MKLGPMVIGSRHTGIICKDIDISINFYRDILGLSIIQDFWDNSEYINIITGMVGANVHMIKLKAIDGTVIELLEYVTHPTDLVKTPVYNVGACHLALRVANAEDAYLRLTDNGITVLSPPILSSEGIAKVFFCLDPNSVRIELVEMLT
jgi:catechol 2,3-dioxygenase-like lactoylglutathione lyase family enzyme